MGYLNTESLIGWHNESTNHFLCDECFEKEKDIEKNNYEPVMGDRLRDEDMYICDACGKRFEGPF